jgi:hypothetical protein
MRNYAQQTAQVHRRALSVQVLLGDQLIESRAPELLFH